MGYLGVVTGVGNGNFAPLNVLTREQAAAMLSRLVAALGTPPPNHTPTFADNSDISSWAFAYVGQVQGSGIMGGTGENRFSPAGHFTMEQSIATMLRIFDRAPGHYNVVASVPWSWSAEQMRFGDGSAFAQLLAEPVVNAVRFTLEFWIVEVFAGNPYGRQNIFILSGNEWVNVGYLYAPDNSRVTTIVELGIPTTIAGIAVALDTPQGGENYRLNFNHRDFIIRR